MKQKIFNSAVVVIGLLMILGIIGHDYLWGFDAKSKTKKGYLGVSVKRLTSSLKEELKAEQGVVVVWVDEDGPAEKAGIVEDDVLMKVGDTIIQRPESLTRVIRKIKPGTEVKVEIVRDGKKQSLNVKIGKLRSNNVFIFNDDGDNCYYFRSAVFLGVELTELTKDLAAYFGVKPDAGALILEVVEDSPAEKAGIKAGDVIVKIEDEDISEPADVREILSDFEDGDKVAIEVVRHQKSQSFTVMLGESARHNRQIQILDLPNMKQFENQLRQKIEENLQHLYDDERINKFKFDIDTDFSDVI